jgi:hypothetical protein
VGKLNTHELIDNRPMETVQKYQTVHRIVRQFRQFPVIRPFLPSWEIARAPLPGAERSAGSGPAAPKCLELEIEAEEQSIWLMRGLARLLRTKEFERLNVAPYEIVVPRRMLPVSVSRKYRQK